MSQAPPSPVLVVGTGLIGASVGLALSRSGVRVLLEDADPAALAEAVARGAGEPRTPATPPPAVVVVAVPPTAAGAAIERELRRWPQATVTDVTSVKAVPLAQALALAGDPARLVGGHPMAGREVSGPGAARADLFEDRPWVVAPAEGAEPGRVDEVVALVEACGAVPVTLDPAAHDRAVALTSHTPQVLASLLAARLAEADPADVAISGQGLRDVTRLAASDPVLWTGILGANAGPVADVLDAVAADLERMSANLRQVARARTHGDDLPGSDGAAPLDAVASMLVRGNEGRAAVPGKHGGPAAGEYTVVPVVVDDRAGALAALFAAVAGTGVSVEDVRIEHTYGRLAAVVELSVLPASAEGLAEALRAGGWALRA